MKFSCRSVHGDSSDDDNDRSSHKPDIDSQTENLRKAVVQKANALLGLTAFLERVKPEDVAVSYDGNCFSASIKCPACAKMSNLSFPHILTPSLYNFKKHFTTMHVNKPDTEPKEIKGQLKITDAFKRVAEKENNLKDGDTFDLTKEASAEASAKGPEDVQEDANNGNKKLK